MRQKSYGEDGDSCKHRSKTNSLSFKNYRKKFKNKGPGRECEECVRAATSPREYIETNEDVQLCTACALVMCPDHAHKHALADRSGGPHAIFFSVKNSQLWCHPCDLDLEPVPNASSKDPVREWMFAYKSQSKTKADTKIKSVSSSSASSSTETTSVSVTETDRTDNTSTSTTSTTLSSASSSSATAKTNGHTKSPSSASSSSKDSTSTSGSPKQSRSDRSSNVVKSRNGFISLGVKDTMIPAKGLANLGNTCFFNSVMQCVMHTHHLQYYFEKFGPVSQLTFDNQTVLVYDEKINLEEAVMSVPRAEYPLNTVLCQFLGEFRSGSSPAPSPVFSQISRKAPRFKGWQQQDAHELLRYLMDGLRSEEQEQYKMAIASHFGLPHGQPLKKGTDPNIIKAAKGYLQAAGRPLLDMVFGGTLLQTIRCTECGHVSERNEQFLDLSVPLSSNPMSARLAGGKTTGTLSKYQKKKQQSQTKKELQKKARQNKANGTETESATSATETVDDINGMINNLAVSEDEESDFDDDPREIAGIDPLDNTKVLVAAPSEYKRERSVGSALLEFTAEEMLAGVNCYECEKCCTPRNKKEGAKGVQKKRVEAVKRYLIYEPPAVLTLHLKRFQQISASSGRMQTQKLGGSVDFPVLFDIAPFCCRNVERIETGQRKILYSLYGVVVHSGSLSGGHYIAYVKSRHRVPQAQNFLETARGSCVSVMEENVDPKVFVPENEKCDGAPDGQWYYVSDSQVRTVSENQVLSAEAYILFYERIY